MPKLFITPEEEPAKTVAPAEGDPPWRCSEVPHTRAGPIPSLDFPATWRSGYAAACKAVYTGSIPVVAFAPSSEPAQCFHHGHGGGSHVLSCV
jgi:hypothetical protein